MSKYGFVPRIVVFAVRLGDTAALTLCLVQCSAEQPGDGVAEPELGSVSQALETCGGRACGSNADCKIGNPVCSVQSTSYCLLDAPRQCAWKLDTSNANCHCVEHDVRLCTLSGGAAGVQICTKTSSTAADWAACTATPACTP
jgi:hypothetical protein